MRRFVTPFLFLVLVQISSVIAADSREISEALKSAMAALPIEAKPLEMRRSEGGATYALLPNGCEMIVFEKHSAPVVTVQAWMRTGSIDENKWMGSGLSHFCEHMLFKGTNKRPTGVLDQDIRGAGGDDNAYTTYERTVYHITSQAEGFDTAFGALSDMVMDSTMPVGEATKEHGVVFKEIEISINSPDSVLNDVFQRLIYQVHPYGVPVLGYPDRFKTITREDVYSYYQQRYSPQMCTFIIVGDVDTGAIMPKMAKTLSSWVRKSVDPVVIPEEPPQVAPRTVKVTHPVCQLPKIMIGFPGVAMRHADVYALDILADILGDGRTSRLYRELKDKQKLVLDISAFDYTPQFPGYFGIMATADEDKVDAAQAAILTVLEQSKTQAPTEEELARAKQKVYTQHVFAQMTMEGVAGDIGSGWFDGGDLDFSQHYTERMQSVTAEQVVAVAKKYFAPERVNIATMGCEHKDKTEAAPVKATAPADSKKAETDRLNAELQVLQKDPNLEKVSLLADRGIFEMTFKSSGIHVVVKEDKSLPVLNLSIASLGGVRWEPAGLGGSANLMAEMLDRGTPTRNKLAISKASEDLGATLATFSGKNSFGINVSGLSKDSSKLVELASDCILHPAFPDDEFEMLKQDTLQQITEEDESLFAITGKVIRPLLYGEHPYSRTVLGTTESVKKATTADLKKLHEAWLHPENLALCFVGDISPKDAVELARAQFNTLKAGAFTPPVVPTMGELKGSKNGEVSKSDITNDVLELGFRGASLKNPDREVLDLLASDLSGLGGRFFVAIREKQGNAYAVGVNNDSQLDGGGIVFYIQTDPANVDKALSTMWEEVKKLRDTEIPKKELDSVKTYMSGTEAIELQNQSDLAQRLALSQLYGEGAAYVFARKSRLEKLTPADVKAAANKYLDLNNWAKALLKPK